MAAILENGAVCETHALPTISRSFVILTQQWLILDMQTMLLFGCRYPPLLGGFCYSTTAVLTDVRAGTTVCSTSVCKSGYKASQTVTAKSSRSCLKLFVASFYRIQRTTRLAPLPLVAVRLVISAFFLYSSAFALWLMPEIGITILSGHPCVCRSICPAVCPWHSGIALCKLWYRTDSFPIRSSFLQTNLHDEIHNSDYYTLCSEKNTRLYFLSYLHEWCVDLNKKMQRMYLRKLDSAKLEIRYSLRPIM